MRSRHSRGETVRLYLDIIEAGVGSTGQAPTIAIQRLSDGQWFQGSDESWQAGIVNNPMAELSAALLPGRYYFDFNQILDELASSSSYIVKKVNATPDVLEYDDLVFGPLSSAVAPQLCAVTGTVFTADGAPARGELVRATLVPVMKDHLGRGVQSDRVMMINTDSAGDFSLALVRGGVFRLEIPGIGFDRKVTIPDAPTVLFTDL